MNEPNYAQLFKDWREYHRLSVYSFSCLIDTSDDFVIETETGEETPTTHVIHDIAKRMGMTGNQFIAGPPDVEPKPESANYVHTPSPLSIDQRIALMGHVLKCWAICPSAPIEERYAKAVKTILDESIHNPQPKEM